MKEYLKREDICFRLDYIIKILLIYFKKEANKELLQWSKNIASTSSLNCQRLQRRQFTNCNDWSENKGNTLMDIHKTFWLLVFQLWISRTVKQRKQIGPDNDFNFHLFVWLWADIYSK